MRRTIEVAGVTWSVYPSGRVTFSSMDEFSMVFEAGSGEDRIRRVTRYAPLGARRPDRAMAELSDAQLVSLFATSQPAWTSPVAEYAGRTAH